MTLRRRRSSLVCSALAGLAPVDKLQARSALIALLVLSSAILTGCHETPTYLSELAALPEVSINSLDEGSQARIREQRALLERALASAEPTSSATATSKQHLAADYGEFGKLMMAYGFPAVSTTCFRNALSLDDAFRWRYYEGVSLELSDRFDDAKLALEAAAQMRPDDVATLIRLGRITVAQGDVESASRWFDQARRVAPDSAAALHGLGRIASMRDEHQKAVGLFERVLELQPSASSARYGLGLSLRQLGRHDEARLQMAMSSGTLPSFEDPLLSSVSSLLVDASELRLAAGSAAAGEGDWKRAVAQFQRAVELSPEDADARFKLATALGEAGQHRSAVEQLSHAVLLDSENRDAFFNLGVALLKVSQPRAALDALTRAVELDPSEPEARLRRALVADSLGEAGLAEADYQELLRGDPSHPSALLALGNRAVRAGQFLKASAFFERLADASPQSIDAYVGLFGAARQLFDFRAAVGALERGLEHRPDDPRLTDLLARVLATCTDSDVRDGQRAVLLARRNFEQAATIDHRETLALALAESGDFVAAVEQQKRLLEEAEAQGLDSALARIQRYLAFYQDGKPVRSENGV